MQRMRRAWAKPYNLRSFQAPNFNALKDWWTNIHRPEELKDYGPNLKGPREEILDKLATLTDVEDSCVRFNADTYMYFNAESHNWYFKRFEEKKEYTSMTYGDKARAIQAFKTDRIRWIKALPLPPPSSP